MKRIVFLVFAFCFFQNIQSQTTIPNKETEVEDNTIYSVESIDVKPEFPGGMKGFSAFIANNYKAPDVAGLKGKIIAVFVVDKDGSVTDIKVLRDVGFGSGFEVIRVLKLSPKWIPGEHNGKKVRCSFALPINIETPK